MFAFLSRMFRPVGRRLAFTMVEVIVAIAVIGALAAAGTLKYQDVKKQAYKAQMLSDLRNYATAQETYRAENQYSRYHWPEELEANGFGYSEWVYSDSSAAALDHFFLRVRHERSDLVCEIDYSRSIGAASDNAPHCYEGVFRNRPPTADFEVYSVPEGIAGQASFSPESLFSGPSLSERLTEQFAPAFSGALDPLADLPVGAEGPGLQYPVGRTLQFLPQAEDEDGDELTYTWSFGSLGEDGARVPRRRFLEPGRVPVTLVVTDAKGVSRRVAKTLTIGLDGTARLEAQWDPCRSYGTGVMVDVAQGNDAPLLWNGAPATGAEWAWQAGPPPFLDLASGFQAYAQAAPMDLGRTFVALAIIAPHAGGGTILSTPGFDVRLSGETITAGGLAFSSAPATTNHWHAIAVQVTEVAGGSEVEVFVDGASKGVRSTPAQLRLSGAPRLFCDATGSDCFQGRAGPVLLYQGEMGPGEMAARVQELSADLEFCDDSSIGVAPQADFSWSPAIPVRGRPARLDASRTYHPQDAPIAFNWAMQPLAGGARAESTGGPEHSWTPPVSETSQFYDVTLVASTPVGDGSHSTAVTKRVEVTTAPVADFIFIPDSALVGQTVSFGSTSSDADPGETEALSLIWSMDGQPAAGPSASRSWTTPGLKPVRLIALDPRGAADTITRMAVVRTNDAPSVTLSCPASAHTGTSWSCTANATDPDGDAVTLSWMPSQSGTAGAVGGIREVSVTAADRWGASATRSATISFTNTPPTVSLSCPASVEAGQAITCTASASDADAHDVTLNASSGWSRTSGNNFSRSYAAQSSPTTVTASITVTDPHGATRSASRNITVNHRYGCTDSRATNYDSAATASDGSCTYPALSATVSCPASAYVNQSFSCTISASGGVAPYTYSFGSDRTQSFSYSTTGTQRPSGTVTDAVGQTANASAAVTIVNRNPSVSISCPDGAEAGTPYTCTANGSDPDGDALSASGWTSTGTNRWMRSFTARNDGVEFETRSITVTDGRGGSASASTSVEVYLVVEGCQDDSASNFNPAATQSDGSCTYLQAMAGPTMFTFLNGDCSGFPEYSGGTCPLQYTFHVSGTDPEGLPVSISGACSASGANGSASCSRTIQKSTSGSMTASVGNGRMSLNRTTTWRTCIAAYRDPNSSAFCQTPGGSCTEPVAINCSDE